MLISPYKGNLVELIVPAPERADLFALAAGLHSIQLTKRQTCDLEMLAVGAFSPLRGFMHERDYDNVIDQMRLADGTLFPIPITLSVDTLTNMKLGNDVALRDSNNDLLAVMNIGEIYEWDPERFADAVLGTKDLRHPLAREIRQWGRFNLAGELRVMQLPRHRDFPDLKLTPRQTRDRLEALGRANVVAFQTRNPLHRAHEAMTQRAIEMVDGTLLLHPAVGMTTDGDIDSFTRIRTYKATAELCYPRDRVLLSLLPLAMRMAGPREAVWHAIIRRNYGASHMVVGRDHASPGKDACGNRFYEPAAAQTLVREVSAEVGVDVIAFHEFAYFPHERRYDEIDKPGRNGKFYSLSGTKLRKDFLVEGREVPAWFIRKEVAEILSASQLPRHRQGVCLWFTGLSGAGKSTTADLVTTLLLEEGRGVTLLDGDVVRTHLSKGLGFSKEDRVTNVRRIGFVASEIVRHGGVAVCAAISPYRDCRGEVRQMFPSGNFVEIFVDTPLDVCEGRDAKGLYARARRGEIQNFTGIDDAYEPPDEPELTLDTVCQTARENALSIIRYLDSKGFLKKYDAGRVTRVPAGSHSM
jgi:sulfate adenylyltransferase